jgi:hypothetical protein
MRNVSCPVRRGADGKGPGHRNLASRLPYNLIAQLNGGVHALRAAVDNLVSNWAYMVMTALAWNLKAWFALSVPEHPRHKEVHRAQKRGLLRMEFKRFVNTIILMPCQIVQGGHRLLYRLLSWNGWQGVFSVRPANPILDSSDGPRYWAQSASGLRLDWRHGDDRRHRSVVLHHRSAQSTRSPSIRAAASRIARQRSGNSSSIRRAG